MKSKCSWPFVHKKDCKCSIEPKELNLSAVDWEEIYACLTHKLERVKAGAYRLPPSTKQTSECYKACLREEDREQRRWIADLKRAIKEIGPDGKRAIELTGAM